MLVYPLLISGKQGSGKSETAQALAKLLRDEAYLVIRNKFAAPLYTMMNLLLDHMRERGFDVPEKDGKLLQLLGTDWGRATFGNDVWVRYILHDFSKVKEMAANYPTGIYHRGVVFLIDDLRFKNEMAAFQEEGFTVRLEANREVRKARANSWRDNDTHQSEVDLDDSLSSFDMVLDTTTDSSPESTAHEILEKFLMYVKHINS